jgi:hypothetical protein
VRALLFVLLILILPGPVTAQTAQFGVRGIGLPGREVAVRTLASGGAFGLFDAESSQNPVSIVSVPSITSTFTFTQGFLEVENPAGTSSIQVSRFPHLMVAGPARLFPGAVGFSFSNYANRDFTIATDQTVTIQGQPANVSDTLSSRGGLNDLRLAGAYRLGGSLALGAAFHIITGSDRLTFTRVFTDQVFLSVRQRSELSFAGIGVSLGLMRQFGQNFAVAAMARSDGHLNLDRDSTRISTVDLPYSVGLGLRVRRGRLDLGAQGIYRTWSGANSDLLSLGGTGARNTIEIAGGGEFISDPKRPFRRPLRFGAHYTTLPFPLVPGGEQGSEFGVSAGSGVRFAQQRGGIDLAIEYLWRSEGVYKEQGFVLSLGVSVRP